MKTVNVVSFCSTSLYFKAEFMIRITVTATKLVAVDAIAKTTGASSLQRAAVMISLVPVNAVLSIIFCTYVTSTELNCGSSSGQKLIKKICEECKVFLAIAKCEKTNKTEKNSRIFKHRI